ncbi:hypothetical protein PLICRDRAFT_44935 [Plicaturopsis crispa FD-325 SS-3]|nr:hypothetical protein PLICRDRAFT_44935 [Plicaturopsis crispa FD-325 SS-3]
MDIDPLGDTVPPRHAVESDDEEDEYNPLSTTSKYESPEVDVKLVGNPSAGAPLVIATGDAGKEWAPGAKLGEQIGAVFVNKVQVGLLFRPPWTKATVLVSEVTTRLPVWAMHTYAECVVDSIHPSSVSLLDTYPIPSYMSSEPLAYDQAPVRYLDIGNGSPSKLPHLTRLEPPNMISSTSASFLSILLLRSISESDNHHGTAIFLPSPHIPPPPPHDIAPTRLPPVDDDAAWPSDVVAASHRSLFQAIGETEPVVWERDQGRKSDHSASKKRGDIGDGGMYI